MLAIPLFLSRKFVLAPNFPILYSIKRPGLICINGKLIIVPAQSWHDLSNRDLTFFMCCSQTFATGKLLQKFLRLAVPGLNVPQSLEVVCLLSLTRRAAIATISALPLTPGQPSDACFGRKSSNAATGSSTEPQRNCSTYATCSLNPAISARSSFSEASGCQLNFRPPPVQTQPSAGRAIFRLLSSQGRDGHGGASPSGGPEQGNSEQGSKGSADGSGEGSGGGSGGGPEEEFEDPPSDSIAGVLLFLKHCRWNLSQMIDNPLSQAQERLQSTWLFKAPLQTLLGWHLFRGWITYPKIGARGVRSLTDWGRWLQVLWRGSFWSHTGSSMEATQSTQKLYSWKVQNLKPLTPSCHTLEHRFSVKWNWISSKFVDTPCPINPDWPGTSLWYCISPAWLLNWCMLSQFSSETILDFEDAGVCICILPWQGLPALRKKWERMCLS